MEAFWALWVVGIAVSFGVFEWWALKTNRATLSRTVWDFSKAWPPLPFVARLRMLRQVAGGVRLRQNDGLKGQRTDLVLSRRVIRVKRDYRRSRIHVARLGPAAQLGQLFHHRLGGAYGVIRSAQCRARR